MTVVTLPPLYKAAQGALAKGWSLLTLSIDSSSSSSHRELGSTIVVYSIDPIIQIVVQE
jgi:hypothetical protein